MLSFFKGYNSVWLTITIFFFVAPGFTQNVEVKPPAVSSAMVTPNANIEQSNDGQEADDEELSGLKDPFESAFPKKQAPEFNEQVQAKEEVVSTDEAVKEEFDYSNLNVSGLVWGEASPKVIINDAVYGIGDEINGGKIASISKEGITFKYNNKNFLMKRESLALKEKGGE